MATLARSLPRGGPSGWQEGCATTPLPPGRPAASLLAPSPAWGGTAVGCCVPREDGCGVPPSQAQGAPAAPSPAPRLGSAAKAPARRDGARRAGGRAGAFGRPSGVRAAAVTHMNGTRVRGGRSAPHVPAPSACPCPLLQRPPNSLGCAPSMGWQHPTVPPWDACKPRATLCCASSRDHISPAMPAQPPVLPHMQPGTSCAQTPHKVPTRAPLRAPVRLHHFTWATCVPPPDVLPQIRCPCAPRSSLSMAQRDPPPHPRDARPCASPWEHSAAPLAAHLAGRGDCQPHGDMLETKGPQWDPHLPWHPGPHPGWLAVLGLN